MATKTSNAAISDVAVSKKTGKLWSEWFAILDEWGAAGKGHKLTARYLSEAWGLSGWWSQSVTVRYEQVRGLREVGQRSEGTFVVSARRTIRCTPEQAFDALTNPAILSRWFTQDAQAELKVGGRYSNGDGDQGEFLILERPNRVRFTWGNPEHSPGSVVEVSITGKPDGRVLILLDHSKISNQAGYEDMKDGWTWAMDSLKSFLETGDPIPHP